MNINKNLISIISILLLINGCSNKDIKVENNAQKSAKENRVVDATSPYRDNLRLLGKFKERVPMANVIQEILPGKCSENISDDGKTRCITKTEYSTKSNCIENNKMKIEKVVEKKLDKNTTLETYYTCVDNNEETEIQVFKKLILKDKRYISVAPIINKSASENLPKDIDTIVKNAINNISSNYVLVDTDNAMDNEYRIEGAITGFDTPYERSNSVSGDIYGGQGRGEFDISGGNSDGIVVADLSIDFIIKKYRKELKRWEYVKNVSTSNKIKLLKTSKGYAFSFGILGGGVALNESVSTTNGLAFITRALVERSILELLAKLDDLPYWSFLPNPSENIDTNWNQLLTEYHRKNIPNFKEYYRILTKNLLNIWNPRGKGYNLESRIINYKKYYYSDFVGQLNDKIDETLVVHLLNKTPIILNAGKSEQKRKTINNSFEL